MYIFKIKISSEATGIYLAVFLVSLFGPELAKSILTGSAGPNTSFAAAVILCPLAFAILGAFKGKPLLKLHAALLALLAFWTWVCYPSRPPMNFMRQIAHDLPVPSGVIYLLGWILSARPGIVPALGSQKNSEFFLYFFKCNFSVEPILHQIRNAIFCAFRATSAIN